MDVVSDAISTVRVGEPFSNRARVTGSWSARFAPYEGAGFHVVLAGGCWLLPDGGGEPITLGPGDAVLLPHGSGHVMADAPPGNPADRAAVVERAIPFEDWMTRDLHHEGNGPGPTTPTELLCGKYRLNRSRAHPLMAELPDVIHLPHRLSRNPELRGAIGLLGMELAGAAARPGACLAVPGLLDLLLVYMIRTWITEHTTESPTDGSGRRWPAALGDPVVSTALRALHTDPAAPWTNDRLAAEVGVSRPTLTRRFTARVGRAPMTYLTWWRMTRAAALLRDSTDPLDTIARRVGYSTPFALSHAFSREFGTTPGRYRAQPARNGATPAPAG
ncbi:AraC family transcriptional regulator [Streptomyces sp. NPDC059009]|uniref:AraC family transcriptional regulator n=1 Tax=Streptomyces sp. NPDC059009 TaxID=3346694 RepID=UPI0036CB0A16